MAVQVGQSKYKEGVIGDFYTRNITANTKIEWLGNWDRVARIFNGLPQDIKIVTHQAILEYANKYYHSVIGAINNNGGSAVKWKPYSRGYAAAKRKKGLHGFPSFYRLKGMLVKAIKVETHVRGQVRVTINKNAQMSNSDTSLNASQLMNILEHGSVSRGISKRPLFGPVWSSMGGNKALSKFVSERIGRKIITYRS
jgi:hypothetical protein